MILIGQFDSSFVRRVGVAMEIYGMGYDHRPWSVFGDADSLAAVNPLRRVPTLICDDGTALIDSAAIIDWLDGEVGPERALFPPSGRARRDMIRVTALFCGAADKLVSLFYELNLHEQKSEMYEARCRAQIGDTLALLERERAAQDMPWWGGEQMGHADIANACMLRHMSEAIPGLIDLSALPALSAIAERCEAMAAFQKVQQRFIPPM